MDVKYCPSRYGKHTEFVNTMLRKLFGPKGVNVIGGMEQIA